MVVLHMPGEIVQHAAIEGKCATAIEAKQLTCGSRSLRSKPIARLAASRPEHLHRKAVVGQRLERPVHRGPAYRLSGFHEVEMSLID